MRQKTRSLPFLAVWVVVVVPAFAHAQEDFEAMLPQPTAEHRHLIGEVGTWDATITSFMNGPGQPPTVSKGVETNRMMGDFWLLSEFEGDFGGMPFRGHSQIGFDPKAGHYVMSWVDTMNPKLSTQTGTYDPDSKTYTFEGKAFDPMLDKEVDQKTVSVLTDADHKVFTLFMKAPEYGDDWVEFMKIEYTRRKN
ncbi:DUF1579 domain-containing protein [Tautonia marina]|uniref:DUF1579 domain-containing protein n=1 Tax=Tautonia marina TaxID=2653855 RepID=UPI0012605AFF|nr:DUF1579 domain-containing protein [Tautonia marina]